MQEELRQVETPEILLTLIQQLNYTAWEKEKILQTEENGNKIANLQGFLAGVRSYKNTMRNIGYILDEKFYGLGQQNHQETRYRASRGRKERSGKFTV